MADTVTYVNGNPVKIIDNGDGTYSISQRIPANGISADLTTGKKTVTSVAATMFAAEARKAGRYQMIVFNESDSTLYYGKSNVTTDTGMALLSGDSVTFKFDDRVDTDIYFIATATKTVRVVEI